MKNKIKVERIKKNLTQKQLAKEIGISQAAMAEHYQIASDKSSEIVEKMARQILAEHSELDEFVMAMGLYFFTYKNSSKCLSPITQKMNSSFSHYYEDSEPFLKQINDFMKEWNSVLKITGDSMRFTATGDKITEW